MQLSVMWTASREGDGDSDVASWRAEEDEEKEELRSLWFCLIRAMKNGEMRWINDLDMGIGFKAFI